MAKRCSIVRYKSRPSMEQFTHIFTRKWKVTCDPMFTYWFIVYLLLFAPHVIGEETNMIKPKIMNLVITIRYNDTVSGKMEQERQVYDHGHLGFRSKPESGILVHVRGTNEQDPLQLCSAINTTIVPKKKWIALIKRGKCNFTEKIRHAAKESNASAVVIYDDKQQDVEDDTRVLESQSDIISVLIDYDRGRHLIEILDKDVEVHMTITISPPSATTPTNNNGQFAANNTSVLFVSISFIVLIIISLAWLVFYYIQRCRYTNAKERLSRRLANAAKKAIAKIPQRSVKLGDKELDAESDQCAVCIEPYKLSDVIRVLPCKHVFHKSCVDPWLLDQRSCPMCKMDILRAFGMHLNGSQESVPQDQESGTLASSPIMGDTDHLSNSEEQGAVGGVNRVNIVLYHDRTGRYHDRGAHYHDSELSSEGSLECGTSRLAQCHVELTNDVILENRRLCDEPSLARSMSAESLHTSDSECNEIDALMTGVPEKRGSGADTGAKTRRKSSGSSIGQSFHDARLH